MGNFDLNFVQDIDDRDCEQVISNDQLCTVFLCGDRTTIPHQLGFQRLTAEGLKHPPSLIAPEKVIDFHGHVIGMAISPDGSKLYVNVRAWPENAVPTEEQLPPISTTIDLHVIDLRTLTRTGEVNILQENNHTFLKTLLL